MVMHHLAYSAVQYYLPLPIAITLGCISPLFVYIYDYFLYGVTINQTQVIFLIVSILGVALTANGAYLITFIDSSFDHSSSF